MAVLAAVTILLSLLWLPGAGTLFERVAGGTLPTGTPGEALLGLGALFAGLAVAWWLRQRGRLLTLGLAPTTQSAAGNWLGLPTAIHALVIAPVLTASRLLAWIDARVVDAGVRRTAWLAGVVADLFSRRAEPAIDGLVRAVAQGTLRSALGARVADEAGIDGAVEATGRAVGVAGHQSRRLQTGLSHHYYSIVAGGLVVIVIVLFTFR